MSRFLKDLSQKYVKRENFLILMERLHFLQIKRVAFCFSELFGIKNVIFC